MRTGGLGRGQLDHLPVGLVLLDPPPVSLVVHVLLPVVALQLGARGEAEHDEDAVGGTRSPQFGAHVPSLNQAPVLESAPATVATGGDQPRQRGCTKDPR